ncbi:glyoxalase [Pseudomonas sp. S10E 269]|uniref:VOC family protein n=1 Tax=unclassified Pseudomonas TaxID=196821 RepID=UPI000C25A7D1|nr:MULTISPECIES: glyoxalase [unclassified Pseudomonas]MBT1259808.1 glyoxalase [Pseudomonas sp. VS40]MBT1272350.1 glyoxalase [Pseudomonas sp. VS59]PJK32344.1 glyoxalase [Pseudomonas sp. S09F 262]PJK41831.1 glyoxalase [Pseudomonas sp. S10E 269]
MSRKVRTVALAVTLLAEAMMGNAFAATAAVAVAPQYDTSHVYVAPADVDRFTQSFLATFGGKSTPQVVVNVLPVPSSTTSQLLQTPVGTVSLFGFTTPIPHPFGQERNGYLVKDMDLALKAARENGAAVIVSDFPDPIGRDAVVQWPGGVNMQLYWHTKTPDYAAFQTVPENRVYLSAERADSFIKSFVGFSHGKVLTDDKHAPGVDIGQANGNYRRVDIESPFGRMAVLVTNGQLPYPFGHETTGYQVADLTATLGKATGSGAKVLVPAFDSKGRRSALVEFPGGYVAEIHQLNAAK